MTTSASQTMDLFSKDNGLTTFGIVLALATYTQAVSYYLLDRIRALNESKAAVDEIEKVKCRLAKVTVGDFCLVVLGLFAAGRILVYGKLFNWQSFDSVWSQAFAVLVLYLAYLHFEAWRKAWDWWRSPKPTTYKLQLPQNRGDLTFTYPRDLLNAADQLEVDEWLKKCPVWTPPTKVHVLRPSLELTLSLYHTRLSPTEQTDLQAWLNSFPITMPTAQMAGEPAKT